MSSHSSPRPPAPRRRLDQRGNVAILTTLMLVPISVALGMSYDFTVSQSRKDQISGMADAAALAAVTPAMMLETTDQAKTVAQNLFANQIATVPGISYSNSNISVTAQDTLTGTSVIRNVNVHFTGTSNNTFSNLLGMTGFPVSVSSQATSNVTPNIDFYLLLDTSPSMEIAATTDGINTMVANTGPQGGCAFGCHESNPSADNLGNPHGEDNYTLARALGVTLRIDLVNNAVQNLMTVAQNTENGNGAIYRAGIYTMDIAVNTLQTLTSDLSGAQAQAANIAALEVYNQSCVTKTNCNNDQDSALDSALSTVNNDMPNPGGGTKAPNDTPQEVLFIVSDGVNDTPLITGETGGSPDTTSGGGRYYGPINSLGPDQCTAIKSRGIRIAFLYTTYNPLPTNSWYNTYVAPFQADLVTAAQNCASPGLFFQVSTDGDISTALATLFQKAVETARLTR
jgi:Flp pilus assembly protein TadG